MPAARHLPSRPYHPLFVVTRLAPCPPHPPPIPPHQKAGLRPPAIPRCERRPPPQITPADLGNAEEALELEREVGLL